MNKPEKTDPKINLRDQWTTQQASAAKENTFSVATKQEIDRLAQTRIELEHTCKELRELRDNLSKDIDQLSTKRQAGIASAENYTTGPIEQKSALCIEIKSLVLERDELKVDTQDLSKMRDEIIHEMVLLNTKNAELTKMNNDLSRRAIDREQQAGHSPSPTPSTELLSPISMQRDSSDSSSINNQKVASRNSFNGKHEPKLLKIKKKGSTLFGKLGGKSIKSDTSIYGNDYAQSSKSILYGMSNSSASTQSLAIDSSSRSIRHNPKPSIDSSFSYVSGPHSFQLTSFLRPVKCNACNEKMWGLHEYRCGCCGYQAHAKCLSHVPQICSASNLSLDLSSGSDIEIAKSPSLFGHSLAAQVALENRSVPLLVEKCIEAIELRGMDYEGIYRKSGGAAQMRAIQIAFEQGDTIDLKDPDEINDVAAITSVLKQYFRELPDPLLTYDVYQEFIESIAMQADQTKTDKFISLMNQLPKANYDTLKLLMQHLHRVKGRSSENLMTTKNLAMVFAPTLMRDRDSSRDFLDMSYKNATMDFVIDRAFEIFV
ncbi:Rho GTPase activation protein [Phycomyces blakesleeanus]